MRGEVLFVDWGLSKVRAGATVEEPVVTDRSRDGSTGTRVGQVAGTPSYMAPEQARGDVDAIDARSDVYALGAVAYEVLSVRRPYTGATADEVLSKVLTSDPAPLGRPPLPETRPAAPGGPPLSPELGAAALRAMSRDPADRFRDAGELGVEIGSWLDGARRGKRRSGCSRAPRRSSRRSRPCAPGRWRSEAR
jgi:eukaryotic-like serine/threonine-protein kinase